MLYTDLYSFLYPEVALLTLHCTFCNLPILRSISDSMDESNVASTSDQLREFYVCHVTVNLLGCVGWGLQFNANKGEVNQ